MSEGSGLPQLEERIWDLVMAEVVDGSGDTCYIWAVIDLEEALIRSLLVEFRLPALSRVQELVISAIAEPRPPGVPARPVELRLPGPPHAHRRNALEPAARAALQWTLRGFGVDCGENDAKEDMDATLGVLAVMAYKQPPGLLTGAPFCEAELCRAGYRLLDLQPWGAGFVDWLLTLEVLRPERSGLTHTLVMLSAAASSRVSVLHSWEDAAEICARWRTPGWVEEAHIQGILTFGVNPCSNEQLEAARRRCSPGLFPEGATCLPMFRQLRPGSVHLPLDAPTARALWLALEALAAFFAEHRVAPTDADVLGPSVYTIAEGVEVRVEAQRRALSDEGDEA